VQDDDGAPFRLEACQRLQEQLAIGEVERGVGRALGIEIRQLDLDRPTAPAADEVETRMRQEPMQPGVEPVRVAKPGQVAPGADEGVLDGVARELRITDHEPRGTIQADRRATRERGEGVVIAPSRLLDEASLVHRSPRCSAPTWRLSTYGAGRANRSRAVLEVAAGIIGRMPALSRADVEHVAYLARLGLTAEELTRLEGQLNHILEQYAKLAELDTEHIPPTAQTIELENILRDDVARDSLEPEDVLRNAPDRDGDFIVVPAILGAE
jgi:aspartyl-tRNA(Asn)/glutamyl-tRNA(Gln) amidotransferase subunit C